MGVLLLPAYAWAMWRAWRGGRRPDRGDLLGLGLIPAGLGAYAGYLWIRFGDPLAFARAHVAGWKVSAGWDLAGYQRGAVHLLRRGVRVQSYAQLVDLLGVLLPVVFVVLTVVVFRRLGAAPGIYTALVVLVAVLFAPESVGREFLAAVPAFAVMGLLDRGGGVGEAMRLVAFGCGLLLLFAFATGHFVG
jgi:hypothetical protein